MSVERKLSSARKTVALALHEKGKRLEEEIHDVNTGIAELTEIWANDMGLDAGKLACRIEGRGDGELYIVCVPKPKPQAPEGEDRADDELADERGV